MCHTTKRLSRLGALTVSLALLGSSSPLGASARGAVNEWQTTQVSADGFDESVRTVDARPNVVFILMDDVGYGDLGCYGSADANTPRIDALAHDGVRLTNNYAGGPICTPSRAAFVTGRYYERSGLERNLMSPARDAAAGLSVCETSIARMLKGNGYATGLVGKWHLGFAPQFGPNAHGFDEFFGVLGVVDYWTHETKGGVLLLYTNTEPSEEDGYLTDLITQHAVSFIDEHRTSPFFLEVAYTAAHFPYQLPDQPTSTRPPPRKWHDGTREDLLAVLERADEGIGQITDALARDGLADNTLIVFTSDNGAPSPGSNAPFSGGKHGLAEGGIRVPAILCWPGVLASGTVSSQVAIVMDLTVTILAATRTSPARPLDGINLIPLLDGDASAQDRVLVWRHQGPKTALECAVRMGDWKYLKIGEREELYDLETDPGESRDVSLQNPAIVDQLRAQFTRWQDDVDASNHERVSECP